MSLTTSFTFRGMVTTSDPVSVGPADDSNHLQERAYTQCVDMVNVDVDTDFNAVRRQAATLVVAGNVTSAWSNGTTTYAVMDGLIHVFDGELLAPLGNSPSMQAHVEFLQMNNVIVFSDNLTIGLIEDGVPFVLNSPAESIDILDLETWIKLTYPQGADHDESNLEINAFNIATFAGRCLEFYNGSIYLAVDNFVYCTKTFNAANMDVRYNVVAGFKDPVTMLKAVNDGLFVGTEKEVCFLSGSSGAFTQKRVLPFGTIYGSDVKTHADKITALKAQNLAPVWLTTDGIYAGADGGRVENLTKVQITIPAATSAAAMIRFQGTCWQYVVSLNGDAIVFNLDDTVHSRYTAFDYLALFKRGSDYWGVSSAGLFLLSGDAPVDASFLTPSVDFGVKEIKRCSDVYLHCRTAGEMALDLYVDEQLVAEDIPFRAPFQVEPGARRMRAKLPRGAKGTNWQFRIKNVDGCTFTAFSLMAIPVTSQRTVY